FDGSLSMSSAGVTLPPHRLGGWNVVTIRLGGWVSTEMVLTLLVVMFASLVTSARQLRELSAQLCWAHSVTLSNVAVGVPPDVAVAVSGVPDTSQPVRVTVLPAQVAPML